uniref:Uncharacterized protein n=1 Tax=Solanum tuberosum TaxID=4113 RepID=M1DDQ2_SOLTU
MANGRAKSGSPNGSAMRSKYTARNPVPCLRWGTTGTMGGLLLGPVSDFGTLAKEVRRVTNLKLLGQVGDLGTLPKEVWRVSNLEISSPNGAHLQLLLLT